ncbi:cytochrome P450 2C28-like [Ciona intestinalis]
MLYLKFQLQEEFYVMLYQFYTPWCVLLLFLLFFLKITKKPTQRLPPGPSLLRVIKDIPRLIRSPEKTLRDWSLLYRPVITLPIPWQPIIYLNSIETVNNAFLKKSLHYAGRPQLFLFYQISGKLGISLRDYSDDLKLLKNFGMKVLKKNNVEVLATCESQRCMEHLRLVAVGQNYDLKTDVYNFVANITSQILFGHRYEYDDYEFRNILLASETSIGNTKDAHAIKCLLLCKWLRFVPKYAPANRRFMENQSKVLNFIKGQIAGHQERFDQNNIDDFIDAYMYEQKFGKSKDIFTDEQLVMYLRDLFVAGIETTSNTIQWLILSLLYHPQYMELMYNEIYEALGSDGIPSNTIKEKCPITRAFIQEAMRYRTVAPSGAPRRAVSKSTINGYDIPAGSMVIANLWAVHNDSEIWPQPNKFDPHRHIDSAGKFVPSSKILPFSVGARYCMGRAIAQTEIFVFVVALLQRFKITRDPSLKWPTHMEDGVQSALCYPSRYKIIMQTRDVQ